MVFAVLCVCLCLLQQVNISSCQGIGADSCKFATRDAEDDWVIKMKQLYAAFDQYRLETNSKIEKEQQKTNELLAEAIERIAKLGE